MKLRIGENLIAEGGIEEIFVLIQKMQDELMVKANFEMCEVAQGAVEYVTTNSALALKKIRIARNFTQKALAQLLDVSEPTVSQYETGARKPNIVTLKKLAKILDCTTDQLLEPIEI